MKKSYLTKILACAVVILAALYFIRSWKNKSDRSACIINIRNVQQSMRGYLSCNQSKTLNELGPEKIWNDILRSGSYLRTPVCPAGGTYTFHTIQQINPPLGTVFCTCSHAKTLNHKPDHTADW
jgi:hypothetical protein